MVEVQILENVEPGEDSSEEISYDDLKKRMGKDRLRMQKIKAEKRHLAAPGEEEGSTAAAEQEEPSRRKKMSRAQASILKHMIKIMEVCKSQGFVYGVITEKGKPVTGSSDSLREWWKETVKFDQNVPLAITDFPPAATEQLKQLEETSFLCLLQQLQATTLGSLLSSRPAPAAFPAGEAAATAVVADGKRAVVGEQGAAQDHGPPPYRKPHDLKKAWKVNVLAAVIKHMSSNNTDKLRRVVKQSKCLQHKMSAKETVTWSKIVDQEEALVNLSKKCLKISQEDDEDDDSAPLDI